jgi:flagellar biosynthesis protein FlhG
VTRSNHYAILGLDPGATADQIEKAFRYLTELYADDSLATYSLIETAEARQMRAQIREAYDALRDPVRRLEYDVRHGLIVASANGSGTSPERPTPSSEPALGSAREPSAAPQTPRPPRTRLDPIVLPEPLTGAALREFRSHRGISLREIADTTKIGLRYLEYIETDRHDCLPADVYLRGFLQEYAKAVGLDPRHTADAYLGQCGKREGVE